MKRRIFMLLFVLWAPATSRGEPCGNFPAPGFDAPQMRHFVGQYRNPDYGFAVTIPKGLTGHDAPAPAPHHGFGVVLSWEPRVYINFDGSYNASDLSLPDTEEENLGYLRQDSESVQSVKHKRNKRVRVSIGAPWKRRSMLAMSQLGHYVNRRNVQAAVSQVWPVFFGGREKISAADGRRWGQRWTHEFSIVEVPVRQQAPTDPLGRTTAYTYDALGNVTSVTRLSATPNAVTTTFTYDDTYSNVTSVTDPLGHTTRFTYDAKGNLTSATDPLGNTSIYTYNSAGQVSTAADPNGNVTQFGYTNGDLISVTDPLGRATTRFYDGAGRVTATISAAGDMSLREYNALNLVTKITDPASAITSLTYDKNGNLLTVVDARNNTTTYTYDGMDRLATRKDALLNIESSQYDGVGNLLQFTDRRNKVTTMSYDAVDRLSFVGYGTQSGPTYESTVSNTYDAGNRITQVVDSITGTITLGYDGLDRLTSESGPRGTVSYTYDNASRRSSMTVAGQPAVNYTYDDANRLMQIAQGTSTAAFTYDSAGRRTSLTLPNAMTTTYTYDAASDLTGLSYQLGATKLGDLGYEYDFVGRRTSVGGSFARTGLPTALGSATYNANNQLTQRGSTSFAYDGNGNLTSDGGNTYTWNARNQLASISGGVTASFQYDPFGRRTSKSVGGVSTSYLYDRANIVQELSGSTPTANLLVAAIDEVLARTDGTGTVSYLADALGSTIALANGSGLVQTEYTYEPFGRTTATGSTSTSQQQYAGRENDGTGLYFYRARYYDPNSGRFVSEDPIGLLGGADFYTYAVNDPIDYRDPSGKLVPVPLATAAIGAVAGGLGDLAGQLAQNVRTGRPLTNVDLTEAGVAAAVGAAAGAAAPFVATGYVGAAALGGLANLGQTWITDRVEQKCSSRNKLLLSIALGVAGGLAGGPVSRSNGWDEASP